MHRDESGCIGLGRGVVGKWEMTDNEYWVSFGVSESHSVMYDCDPTDFIIHGIL